MTRLLPTVLAATLVHGLAALDLVPRIITADGRTVAMTVPEDLTDAQVSALSWRLENPDPALFTNVQGVPPGYQRVIPLVPSSVQRQGGEVVVTFPRRVDARLHVSLPVLGAAVGQRAGMVASRTVVAVEQDGASDMPVFLPAEQQQGVAPQQDVGTEALQARTVVNAAAFHTKYGYDGTGIAVAVLDTGARLDHVLFRDAAGNSRIAYQYDFANGDADATDHNRHGSHVAGIIAARPSEASGPLSMMGIAPNCTIIVLKVFEDNGVGNFQYIEKALQWVVANHQTYHIAAVNMSLGNAGNSADVHQSTGFGIKDELASLVAAGVMPVCAAGNNYYNFQTEGVSYPANDPSSIAIGATFDALVGPLAFGSGARSYSTDVDRLTCFTQRSSTLMHVLAPGSPITSASNGSATATATLHGTSMSTPYVAGAILLAQQLAQDRLGRRLTRAELIGLLGSTGPACLDGDDEDDNVVNTMKTWRRLDMLALGDAIAAMGTTNPPPTVALTAPAAGTTYTTPASITMTAQASDNGSIVKVAFYDGTTRLGEDTAAPYVWTRTTSVVGTHVLKAIAYDNLGASTTSATVSVTVQAPPVNQAPTVAVTAPAAQTRFTMPFTATVAAAASDSDGTIAKVEFYDGATLIGTDTTAPYAVSWSSTVAGTHNLKAKATDNQGAATTSASVAVTVQAGNQPPTAAITAPTSGGSTSAGVAVHVAAVANDADGSVAKVEFFDGLHLIGSDTTAPFAVAWTPTTAGLHSLTAKATDNAGATGQSAVVAVNVTAAVVAGDTIDTVGGVMTAAGENPAGWNGKPEGVAQVFDNDAATKWLDFALSQPQTRASWLLFRYPAGKACTITAYTLTSANDAAERDPAQWLLQGSNDGGATWTSLDGRTGEVFAQRRLKRTFAVAQPRSFAAYRLAIQRVANPARAIAVQLAEWELLGSLTTMGVAGADAVAQPLPLPWRLAEVGASGVGGWLGEAEAGASLALSATGGRLGWQRDQCHGAVRALAGDGVLTARLETLAGAQAWAMAGVTFRTAETAEAAHLTLGRTVGQGAWAWSRAEDGARTVWRAGSADPRAGWLRLERRDGRAAASLSSDGQAWTELVQLDLAGPLVIGPVVAGEAQATFAAIAVIEPVGGDG
jgi:subtilisin family serine protease